MFEHLNITFSCPSTAKRPSWSQAQDEWVRLVETREQPILDQEPSFSVASLRQRKEKITEAHKNISGYPANVSRERQKNAGVAIHKKGCHEIRNTSFISANGKWLKAVHTTA